MIFSIAKGEKRSAKKRITEKIVWKIREPKVEDWSEQKVSKAGKGREGQKNMNPSVWDDIFLCGLNINTLVILMMSRLVCF